MPNPPVLRRNNNHIPRAASPRTPTCGSPAQLPIFLASAGNRKSSDSWTSSNDPREEIEAEWQSDQVLLLLRTLDALPSHTLTPFIGPVPPSNLLDKLAKGVVEAKTTSEWPHSIRKTRYKLVELARQRAKEAVQEDARKETIAEENGDHRDVFQPTTNIGSRRPLARQSSMDFMEYAKMDLSTTDPYSRVLERLQRAEHIQSASGHHPYCRPGGRSSYPDSSHPSTPSSTTLNSTRSARSSRSSLRRTTSTLSISSTAPDWYVGGDVGCDHECASPTRTRSRLRKSLKRAPDFGISQSQYDKPTVKQRNSTGSNGLSSSDEEEKLRSMKAKKARTQKRTSDTSSVDISSPRACPKSPADIVMASPGTFSAGNDPVKSTTTRKTKQRSSNPSKSTDLRSGTPTTSPQQPRGRRANLQRNPSIFGPELPNPQMTPSPPTSEYYPSPLMLSLSPKNFTSPSPAPSFSPTPMNFTPSPRSSCTPTRTLRRVRQTVLRSPRRISFGGLLPSADDGNSQNASEMYGSFLLEPVEIRMSNGRDGSEENPEGIGRGLGLGSAFQLR